MNIYTKLINKINKSETADVIAEVLTELDESGSDIIQDSGILDFSATSFKAWFRKAHPEIAKNKRYKTDGEDLFYSLSNDTNELFKYYAEYAVDNNLVKDILDILSELEYGYQDYEGYGYNDFDNEDEEDEDNGYGYDDYDSYDDDDY
jgi:hypothetical protein